MMHFLFPIFLFLSACSADHYFQIEKSLLHQNYEQAYQDIQKAEKDFYGSRDRLLFLMDAGMVAQKMGQYKLSNQMLDEADRLFSRLSSRGIQEKIAAYTVTELNTNYAGEIHERVMVNLLRSLNYYALGEFESALAMARRVNNTIKEYLFLLKDEVKKGAGNGQEKNIQLSYVYDAFAEYVIGKSFLGNKDVDNALVNFRLAIEHYQNDFSPKYQIQLPQQVLKDYCQLANSSLNQTKQKDEAFQKNHALDCKNYPSPEPFWPEKRAKAKLLLVHFHGLINAKRSIFIDVPVDGDRLGHTLAGLAVGGVMMLLNPQGDKLYNLLTGVMIANPWIYLSVLTQLEAMRTKDPLLNDVEKIIEFGGMLDQQALRIYVPYVADDQWMNQYSWMSKELNALQSSELRVNSQPVTLEPFSHLGRISRENLREELPVSMLRSICRAIVKKMIVDKLGELNPLVALSAGVATKALDRVDLRMWRTLPARIDFSEIELPIGTNVLQGTLDNKPIHQDLEMQAGRTKLIFLHSFGSSQNLTREQNKQVAEVQEWEGSLRYWLAQAH